MTDDNRIELTRRKVLAGASAVGLAGAGAGLGTSAFFSDRESFTNNSFTAGELDLKLDYRATYAGGSGRLDEIDDTYSESGPGEPFPVEEEEDGVYLIGEVPDPGDFGDGWDGAVQEWDFCDPEYDLINGDEIPVFTLQDVKPGDAGEVTMSLHLCDNPGWVWMWGGLSANDENTVTEPEADAEGENNDETDSTIEGDGELADAIQTKLWYDEDCNNEHDGEGEDDAPVCVQLVLDTSGSIGDDIGTVQSAANDLAGDVLGANEQNEVGVTTFADGANVDQSVSDSFTDLSGLVSDGGTNMSAGIDDAGDDLENCTEGHDKVMIVFTDGAPDSQSAAETAADDLPDDVELYAIGVAGANENWLDTLTGDSDNVFVVADDTDAEDAIDQVFAQVAQAITGEEVIFEGSLADLFQGNGDWDGLESGAALDGNRGSEGRDHFAPKMTQCLGLEWELPLETNNKVQSDSVEFDLGFYTEQYRHNDGTSPEAPFAQSD